MKRIEQIQESILSYVLQEGKPLTLDAGDVTVLLKKSNHNAYTACIEIEEDMIFVPSRHLSSIETWVRRAVSAFFDHPIVGQYAFITHWLKENGIDADTDLMYSVYGSGSGFVCHMLMRVSGDLPQAVWSDVMPTKMLARIHALFCFAHFIVMESKGEFGSNLANGHVDVHSAQNHVLEVQRSEKQPEKAADAAEHGKQKDVPEDGGVEGPPAPVQRQTQ